MAIKQTLLTCIVLLLSGCSLQHIPIKGTYLTKPFEISSEKSFEEVWNKTIDLFAQNGIPIKTIDKSSGLIVSDRSKLTWTFENEDGKPVKPDAYVVIEKIIDPGPMRPIKPSSVNGDWNIRVRATPEGGTKINVNLVNIKAVLVMKSNQFGSETDIQGVSTGNFEKSIADYVK